MDSLDKKTPILAMLLIALITALVLFFKNRAR